MLFMTITLRTLANISEGFYMVVILALSEGVGALVGMALIAGFCVGVWKLGEGFRNRDRIKAALKCSNEDANKVIDALRANQVPWYTFHRWFCGSLNVYMPMFLMGNNSKELSLIATWDETRNALLSLCLRNKINSRWSVDDATDKVGEEIMRLRSVAGNNPLDASRWEEDKKVKRAEDAWAKETR